MSKIKVIENSEISVLRAKEKIIMPDGHIKQIAQWEVLTSPLELGSLKKPKNTDILSIKINVPSDLPSGRRGFDLRGLFGGVE